MKKLLINGVAGIGLFAGSVAGMLAVTGRLNHEGTRNIPLIGSFFPPPPEAAEGEAGAAGHGDQQGAGDHGPAPVTSDPDPAAPAGQAGETETTPLKRGRSLFQTEEKPAAGGHGGDAPAADAKADVHGAADKPAAQGPATGAAGKAPTASEKDFQGLERRLADRNSQYSPGSYFRFDGLPAGISPERVNEVWQRAQQQLADLDQRKAVMDQREQDLSMLEQDIARRQTELGRERSRLETLQKDLDARIEQFARQVKLVRVDEVAGLKKNAETLASFEASKAAELVQEQWRTEAGQELILKTLDVMDKDALNAILAALPNGVVRDVLERRLRIVREQPQGSGK